AVEDALARRWILGAGEHEHAVTDGADGASGSPEGADLFLQKRRAEVLAHPGGVAAGEDEAVEGRRVDGAPGDGRLEFARGGHLVVEGARLGRGAERAELAVEEQRVAGGGGAAGL